MMVKTDEQRNILIQQIESIQAKAESLYAEMIKMDDAGMDTSQHYLLFCQYIERDIELTAQLKELENSTIDKTSDDRL
jgi:hypothetical protein